MMVGDMDRVTVLEGIDELLAAGRRLQDLDPDRFMRLLSLARAYLAIYDHPLEALEVAVARLQRIAGVKVDA